VHASQQCLPTRKIKPVHDYIILGWNEFVSEKHKSARDAYLAWRATGKMHGGPEHWLMRRTRAQFKLAVCYCKQHEDAIRADLYANSLVDKDYNEFWREIRKTLMASPRCMLPVWEAAPVTMTLQKCGGTIISNCTTQSMTATDKRRLDSASLAP